jgi:F-type H+-transporting ATPase subunit delta
MSNHRIAGRYAKPLLDLAVEQNALEAVKKDMEGFIQLCEDSREFLSVLRSPVIPHLKKGAILQQIYKGKAHKLTLAVFDIITRKNRENLLPEIAQEFVAQYNVKMGLLETVVTTTFPIDDKLRTSFKKIVKDVTGMEAILAEEVKQEIIGGFILRMGDRQLDESVSASLEEIKVKFNKN